MKLAYLFIITVLFANAANAQEKTDTAKKKRSHYVNIGTNGINYGSRKEKDTTESKTDDNKEDGPVQRALGYAGPWL